MRRTSPAWATALALLLCAPAAAQDEQTYLYDANGRLIAATTARAGGDGAMASYLSDGADNRAARAAHAVTPPPTPDRLANPYTLLPTQTLTSANGQYVMTLERGGDLVIRAVSGGAVQWRSCTGQGRSMFARVDGAGRLAVFDPTGAVLWSTAAAGGAGAELILQNNGQAALKTSGGVVQWSSTTSCQ